MTYLTNSNYCNSGTVKLGCGSFFQTVAAISITSVSATVSALSSFIILVVIARSQIRLGSAYHRIIAGMAFFDLVGSLAMMLTTIPMPPDTIYPFQGAVYGNVGTCEAQGFFFVFGYSGSFFMNCSLNLFYVSLIHFRMADWKIRRLLEPCAHIFSWGFAIGTSVSAM